MLVEEVMRGESNSGRVSVGKPVGPKWPKRTPSQETISQRGRVDRCQSKEWSHARMSGSTLKASTTSRSGGGSINAEAKDGAMPE
jgi:hypothetical protein